MKLFSGSGRGDLAGAMKELEVAPARRVSLSAGPLDRPGRWRLVPVHANGQIAFGVYMSAPNGPGYVPTGSRY